MRLPRLLVQLLGPLLLATGAVIGFAGGCFDPDANDSCVTASEGCSCTSGGSCDPGLVCLSGLCVSPDGTTGDGDGDGDGTTGDGDGDPTGDGDGDGDSDMDGVADADDNCPDDLNPNQRDFDGNGIGNVCDVQVFTEVGGTLSSIIHADAGMGGSCTIPVMLEVTGGQVRVQLDDDAALARVEIVSLEIADILDKECALLVTAILSLEDFVIANSGSEFPVSVPHSPAAHDAGLIAGDSNMPHPMLSTPTLEVQVNENRPMTTEPMLDGSLPVFSLDVSDSEAMATITWADAQHVLATEVLMIEQPAPIDVSFSLRGLVGSLALSP